MAVKPKRAGKSLVWAMFSEQEKADIRAAAGIVGKPMSQFVTESALREAETILENFRKKVK